MSTPFPTCEMAAAAYYLARGLAPVPLAGRTKAVAFDGWQHFRADPTDLSGFAGRNVGLLTGTPSGGVHDADLDCLEAVAAADRLLPATGLVYGRAGRPRSHRLYRCPTEPAFLKLKDPLRRDDAGSVLVELRNSGKQSMAPPSVHPDSGERVEWADLGEPGEVVTGELERAVRRVAAAALLARYWPGKGERHDAGLALAGGLLRLWGNDGERVVAFVTAVLDAAGPREDPRDRGKRLDAVRDTAAKLAAGEDQKVTGFPTLKAVLGERAVVVDRVIEWCGVGVTYGARGNGTAGGARVSEVSDVGSGRKAAARPLPAWVPFPTEHIPVPAVREYVVQTAAAMNCDEAYVVLPALTALAAGVGTTHMVSPKRGWKEPAVIWAVAIGLSGTTKSPPYRDVEDFGQDINDRLEAEFQRLSDEHAAKVECWEAAQETGGDPGEKPVPPVEKSFMTSDCIIEALVGVLQDNPRGVLVGRDELAGWIGGFTKYAGKTGASELQNWLQLSNAGTVDYRRKTGDRRKVRVRGAAASVCGTTQPGVIASILKPELRDAGLFARLLPAYPPVRLRKWTEAEVAEPVREQFGRLLDDLHALPFDAWDDGRPRPYLILLTPAAKERFVRFYDANGASMYEADGDLRSAMSKLEAYALRFALLFHCCRHPADPCTHRVSAEDMDAAVAVTRWFVHESDRVYQMLGESAEQRELRELADQVARKAARLGGRISVRELQNSNSRRYHTRQAAELELDTLVAAGFGGWAVAEPDGRGGHREQWYVPAHPGPTTDTSDTRPDGDPDDGDGGSDTGPGPRSDPSPPPTGNGGATASGSTHSVKPPVESDDRVSEVSDVGSEDHAADPSESEAPCGSRVSEANGASVGSPVRFVRVSRADELAAVAAAVRSSERVGLDLETTGLDPRTDRLRLLGLHTTAGTFLIDCFAVDPKPLFDVLAGVELVGHNLLFDLQFLARLGFTPDRVFDTLLASQVLEAGTGAKHGLKDVAERHLGGEVDKTEQKSDWSGELTPAQLTYAAGDAGLPVTLADALRPKLTAAKLIPVTELEHRTLPAVVWMASHGVGFDRAAWEALAAEAGRESTRLGEVMNGLAPGKANIFGTDGRNWNSPEQVKAAFADLGLALAATDDDALATIDHPLAEALRDYRGMVKRAGTYGKKWLKHVAADGRVYPGWRQIGAERTGRMSCARPNAQNLPRDPQYRRCFVAPPGRVLVKADYSQIELRLAAKIADEPVMLAAYRAGKDLHTETARAILGKDEVTKADRQLAKAVNFGLLYGMGAKAFAVYARSNYGVTLSEAEAATYRRAFFRTYPGLKRWHGTAGDAAKDTRTVLGRRRQTVAKFTERLNSPVQGSGGDGVKQALALLWERRAECPGAVPVLCVHDEIVVECDAAEAERVTAWLKWCMIDGMAPFADPVPVEVEASVGTTWGG